MRKNYFAEKKHIYRLLSIAMAEDSEVEGQRVNKKEIRAIVTTLMYRYYDSFRDENNPKNDVVLNNIKTHLEGHGISSMDMNPEDVDGFWTELGKDLKDFYELKNSGEGNLRKTFCEVCKMWSQLVVQSLRELDNDSDGSVRKSIFMNVDSLNIEEKERELKEMVYVIKSDDSVMDRERESFRVVCKIFRIKNSTILWRRLVGVENIEDLLVNDKIKCHLRFKKQMDVNDFNNIKHSICFYEIRGAIIQGAYHVLQRSETRTEDKIYFSDKKWSSLAVWTFSISSLFLYFFVADMVNQVPGHELIFKSSNIQHIVSNMVEPWLKWLPFVTLTIIGVKYCLDWIVLNKLDLPFIKRLTRSDWTRSVVAACVVISLLVVIKSYSGHPWQAIVETFFIPCVLVIMMLSIEWLIFMKQEYSGMTQEDNKKSNAAVLVVLVCAAILTDVCLGIVELIAHSESDNLPTIEDYVSKIASALILGCICFFAGKFLDMYRMQQQTDVHKMKECIKELETKVSGSIQC
ncbi:MAG: hypothetical protein IKY72_07315 [Bacteroidaceae bacterium]|nr:hypothetical protein [Bacteroidaceae bacterium]